MLFQPTRPLRGATAYGLFTAAMAEISTHAPLAGRDRRFRRAAVHRAISTHAPLAGRDNRQTRKPLQIQDFNPRAPCGARQYPCRSQ